MIKIGLTGSIGSGKSTVSSMIKEKGIKVLDADEISREITSERGIVLDELNEAFGPEIFNDDGSLNRRKLAEIAFSSPENTELLSKIVTIRVKEEMDFEAEMLSNKGAEIVFMDIPLLFEYGMSENMDQVWSVVSSKDLRYKRANERDGISYQDFIARDDAQISQQEKILLSDVVIVNNGSLEELRDKVYKELEGLKGYIDIDDVMTENI